MENDCPEQFYIIWLCYIKSLHKSKNSIYSIIYYYLFGSASQVSKLLFQSSFSIETWENVFSL